MRTTKLRQTNKLTGEKSIRRHTSTCILGRNHDDEDAIAGAESGDDDDDGDVGAGAGAAVVVVVVGSFGL